MPDHKLLSLEALEKVNELLQQGTTILGCPNAPGWSVWLAVPRPRNVSSNWSASSGAVLILKQARNKSAKAV